MHSVTCKEACCIHWHRVCSAKSNQRHTDETHYSAKARHVDICSTYDQPLLITLFFLQNRLALCSGSHYSVRSSYQQTSS